MGKIVHPRKSQVAVIMAQNGAAYNHVPQIAMVIPRRKITGSRAT